VKLRVPFFSLQKIIIKHPVTAVLCLLTFAYICTTFVLTFFEDVSFIEAAVMSLPAFLGELGIVESRSVVSQVAILLSLFISIAFLAIITAKITSLFVEFVKRGGRVVKKVNFSKHIIICGWNFQGESIVKEMLLSTKKYHRDVVVLANREKRPIQDDRVEFISGDPTQDVDLIRAGVKRANSVIILTDLTKGANEADAEALMIILAVESLNRKAHTCVQILNSANRIHLERAHADEIICLDQVGGNLVVAAALNHGISCVVSELLMFNRGSEFYRYDRRLSNELIGKEFCEVSQLLARKSIILLGLETDDSEELQKSLAGGVIHSFGTEGRVVVVNPTRKYKIRQGDALFLVAETEPRKL
jgi:voltage-gated potassium channel